jgi:hypothetical protein
MYPIRFFSQKMFDENMTTGAILLDGCNHTTKTVVLFDSILTATYFRVISNQHQARTPLNRWVRKSGRGNFYWHPPPGERKAEARAMPRPEAGVTEPDGALTMEKRSSASIADKGEQQKTEKTKREERVPV